MLLRAIREVTSSVVLLVVRHLPGVVGTRLRFAYYRRRLGALGPGTRIDEGVHFVNPEHVFIGAHCWIAANVFIGAGPPSLFNRVVWRRENAEFAGPEGEVRIGDHSYLAPTAFINGHGGVLVEDDVAVSPGAKIFSSIHHYRDEAGTPGVPEYTSGMRRRPGEQSLLLGPVVVRSGSQLGSSSVVLPGVTVGPRSWLGVGCVARRTLEPGRVYLPAGLTDPI